MRSTTDRSERPRGVRAVVAPRRDLCVDFVNTVAWRGSAPVESLPGLAELLGWCRDQRVIDALAQARLEQWAARTPHAAQALFAEAIALRESLYRILFALTRDGLLHEHSTGADAIGGGAALASDLAALNAALARTAGRHTLVRAERGFGWHLDDERRTAATLLAPVLWSAGDLLVSGAPVRLRHCANPQCLWLFFDDSKNGSRRWCSMQSCGNRAKAHRHYLRQKAL